MRQLESLIRLTEARAKLELREEATESDAIDVVEIMRASMVDTAADPSMGPNGSLVSDRGIQWSFQILLREHLGLSISSNELAR